ncbi:hypothetical protein FIBSPDRAFT_853235 [Athelia psychrophila]|uniref:Uncharacterized protein n=1 Tax=Athelia psychrophila TaxID=1759441 RepID=A0A166R8B2_9AGAM|nr:hypothetical protein FIBSPDRAFT_880075 [Fibularhizoctonia sp. CBS 109695]KZP28012.1 hypothetical protein FIBSPDRAFT_853235 [Fibularhizoctonia sp. CBS 109695]
MAGDGGGGGGGHFRQSIPNQTVSTFLRVSFPAGGRASLSAVSLIPKLPFLWLSSALHPRSPVYPIL